MRRVRRYDLSPRVDLMPLIDVVFLLLTFFIYAMVVLVQVKTSGLALASVSGGGAAETDAIVLVVLDRAGQVVIDGRVVPEDELDAELEAMADRPDLPPVVLTVESGEGELDRVELYQQLLGRIRRAGIEEIRFPEFGSGETGGRQGRLTRQGLSGGLDWLLKQPVQASGGLIDCHRLSAS